MIVLENHEKIFEYRIDEGLEPFLARSDIPELHRPVIRARGKGLSIRTPRYAVNSASVSLQAGQQFTRGGIPELHRLVTRTRGQGLSIRTPRHTSDLPSISLQAVH